MNHFPKNFVVAASALLIAASALAQQGSQPITIARSGSQPAREGPAEKVAAEQYDRISAAKVASAAPAQRSRAQELMGDITPKLAELTDNVLFGDVWERKGLSKRDRSLATVAALIALNRPDQLRSHLRLALTNGVKKEELVEVITHLAFYSGWPNAISAALVAKEVLQ
jgi:4-carboxymuconolactone decarboxylase